MNTAFSRIQTASHKLAEVLYSQAGAETGATEEQASSASAGADSTASTASADENVIDAEYVDVDEEKK